MRWRRIAVLAGVAVLALCAAAVTLACLIIAGGDEP